MLLGKNVTVNQMSRMRDVIEDLGYSIVDFKVYQELGVVDVRIDGDFEPMEEEGILRMIKSAIC